MDYTNVKYNRRSIRLKEYDYSQDGAYFVTICAHNKKCLFGDIVDGGVRLNNVGEMVEKYRGEIPIHFPQAQLDEFVTMPNHIHGIIVLSTTRRGTACRARTIEKFGRPIRGSLPTILRSYKSAVTKRINEMRKTPYIPIWHRNYYEHVIRDEDKLNEIRQYIIDNLLKWELDRENPHTTTKKEIESWQV